ncbi:MAG TPA: ribosome silencing factor [Myxococcota bacterium]|nr:ribosome silencing factor [Myxococcota bacterium]
MATREERLARANRVAEAALDKKAVDLVALDVSELTSYADTFVIATATSDRHARAISDAIREAETAGGDNPLGVEGYEEARWVLIDLGDVIVHVFQEEVRAAYDLERLWSDAPALPVSALDSQGGSVRRA